MSFNKNLSTVGKHALLSPSSYHWLEYDDEKVRNWFFTHQQAKRGVELHEYAQTAIKLKIMQADDGTTLSMYINDCIGFRLSPEVILRYSDNCFGTADAIGFRDNTLRVFDLKTGVTPASMKQLEIYAAIFFHEYKMHPRDVRTILRIYQNDAIHEFEPPVDLMLTTMSRIVHLDALITYLREEEP